MTEKLNQLLNNALTLEMVAVQQQLYFCETSQEQGFTNIGRLFKRNAIDDILQIALLTKHIKLRRGEIQFNSAPKIEKINSIVNMLFYSKKRLQEEVLAYQTWHSELDLKRDTTTQVLLNKALASKVKQSPAYDFELNYLESFASNFLELSHSKFSDLCPER